MGGMGIFVAQILIGSFLCLLHSPSTSSVMMTFTSSCEDTIWPAIVSKPDSPKIPKAMTGFRLQPGESKNVSTPANWTGMIWARTHCHTTENFTCGTGDCGFHAMECPDAGTTMPVATTLVLFTPKGAGSEIDYSVSLAMGFNVPLMVFPRGENCRATGCAVDLNKECPADVQVVWHRNEVIGCISACEAFKESEGHYCGRPSTYSDHFKSFCPNAMTFEDDQTNTIFSCASNYYYDVNFCASQSFPAAPPPFQSSNRRSWPEGYHIDAPAGEEFNSGGKSSSWITEIVYVIIGVTGTAFLSCIGYAIWRYFHREDHNCPSFNLILDCVCCNNWFCCNRFKPSSSDSGHDHHRHHGSTTSGDHFSNQKDEKIIKTSKK